MTKDQQIREIKRLNRNIQRRLANISKHKEFGLAKNQAVSSYKKISQPRSAKGLQKWSAKKIDALHKSLKQFNRTQFSTVRGYKRYHEFERSLFGRFDKSNKETQMFVENLKKKMFELYGRFVEDKVFLEKYKYNIWVMTTNAITEGQTDEEILEMLEERYNELMTPEEVEQVTSVERFNRLFPKASVKKIRS